MAHKEANIVHIYLKDIARLHIMPKEIISNIDPTFTSNIWKGLFKGFGTYINFGTVKQRGLIK